jgi:hypothetical protein
MDAVIVGAEDERRRSPARFQSLCSAVPVFYLKCPTPREPMARHDWLGSEAMARI